MDARGIGPNYRHVVDPVGGRPIGYLLSDSCSPPCVIPCDRLGIPVGAASSEDDAAAALVRLAREGAPEVFEALLPATLPDDHIDAHLAESDWIWRRVVVVESGPTRAAVRPETPTPGEAGRVVWFSIPADDLLHRAR